MNINIDDELFRSIQDIWLREFHDRPPESVWHYTNKGGLTGILKSGVMHATSIKHLNDPNEFKYGQNLVDEILTYKESQSPDLKPLLHQMRNRIDLFGTQREVYIVCFSTECDSRRQWEKYGDYSIGFLSPLLNFCRKKSPFEHRWCKVEYERTKQLRELGAVIDCWCSYLRRERDQNQKVSLDVVVGGLAEHLVRFLCRFKESRWKEEKEWRLVCTPDDEKSIEVHYRNSPQGKVPYVKLDLSPEMSSHNVEIGKLPIREVMHGPGLLPAQSISEVRALLTSTEYFSVHCSSSNCH